MRIESVLLRPFGSNENCFSNFIGIEIFCSLEKRFSTARPRGSEARVAFSRPQNLMYIFINSFFFVALSSGRQR